MVKCAGLLVGSGLVRQAISVDLIARSSLQYVGGTVVFRRLYKSLNAARYTLSSSLKCRRFWKSCPPNPFTSNGFEVIPNYMPIEECQRLLELSRATLKDHSYRVKDLCYTTVRAEIGDGKDSANQTDHERPRN